MNERERTNDGSNPGGADPSLPVGGGNLNQLRQRAQAFYAAADAAIDNVMSGDSTKFNESARQQGGE
ncbi:MAG: hypothetical protein EXS35_03305 [Pedosphaera sp.]|nr:hypothetical protein [Pedosphaera sp.]